MDKVSVVIPIYNREKYIKKCIDSVINQTYNNLEIICVDDCSTDSSLEILKKYEATDNRVTIVALEKNNGVSNARNTGIKKSTGKYLAFVDSDDTIDKNMIFEMVDCANKTGADIILSDLCMFSGGKKRNMTLSIEPLKLYPKKEIENSILPRFTFDGEDNLGLFSFSTKLYKKSIITDNNICFDTNIAYEEDKLFVIEVLANCNSLYYIPKEYYKYDTSSGGLYSAFNQKAWVWYVKGYEKYKYLIDRYQIKNANKKYLANSFIYNISWFLYRSQRIKEKNKRRTLQNLVIKNSDVQRICSDIVELLTSFDKRTAKLILTKSRFFTIKLINFIYSGKKDKLLKIIKRQ